MFDSSAAELGAGEMAAPAPALLVSYRTLAAGLDGKKAKKRRLLSHTEHIS